MFRRNPAGQTCAVQLWKNLDCRLAGKASGELRKKALALMIWMNEMKRHTALTQLSREHHTALVLAKRALRASAGGFDTMKHFAAEVESVFARDLEPHFQLEERLILPALVSVGQSKVVERTLAEHAELRSLASQPDINQPEILRRFGNALAEHVRFEECELFPLAESTLDEEALESIRKGTAVPLSIGQRTTNNCATEPSHEPS